MKSLGIIGFGAFGRLAARELSHHFKVQVADKGKISNSKYEVVSITKAAASDVVLLCVPISQMKPTLQKIRESLREGAIIVDICSLKVLPVMLMKQMLPSYVQIISTHPLFGPQSAAKGVRGKTIVVCKVRASQKTMKTATSFLRRLGVIVKTMTPVEHDRQAAKAQALTAFVFNALEESGVRDTQLPLASKEKLVEAMDVVRFDSKQLFRDMNNLNPFAKGERKKFTALLNKIDAKMVSARRRKAK